MKTELVEQAFRINPDVGLLINAVSQRVRQLAHGRPPLIKTEPGMRNADIALRELIEGKIKIVRNEPSPLLR
jgi:DNA-directed RNA polymerase subunit omega